MQCVTLVTWNPQPCSPENQIGNCHLIEPDLVAWHGLTTMSIKHDKKREMIPETCHREKTHLAGSDSVPVIPTCKSKSKGITAKTHWILLERTMDETYYITADHTYDLGINSRSVSQTLETHYCRKMATKRGPAYEQHSTKKIPQHHSAETLNIWKTGNERPWFTCVIDPCCVNSPPAEGWVAKLSRPPNPKLMPSPACCCDAWWWDKWPPMGPPVLMPLPAPKPLLPPCGIWGIPPIGPWTPPREGMA